MCYIIDNELNVLWNGKFISFTIISMILQGSVEQKNTTLTLE